MRFTLDLRKLKPLTEGIEFKKLLALAERYRKEIENDKSVGFTDLPDTDIYLKLCEEVTAKLPDKTDTLLVLGIGGSALGTKALRDCFPESLTKKLIVLDNIDPHTISKTAKSINPKTTVVNVISKSGSTIETISQFKFFFDLFKKELGESEAVKRFVLTTDPEKGPLRKIANGMNMLSLPVPSNVGGRFSVLTPVGLFPLLYCGIDVESILKGASFEKKEGEKKAETGAVLDYLFFKEGKNIKVCFIYSDRLYTLGEWYLQLFAESLGKRRDREGNVVKTGATAVLAKGVTDQHSQVQLYKEGPDDKFFAFFKVEKGETVKIPDHFDNYGNFSYLTGKDFNSLMDAEFEGTVQSLEKENKPLICYRLEDITPETIGRFIYLFEMQTALTGYLFNINPFDQPGVEEGKIIAKKLLGFK